MGTFEGYKFREWSKKGSSWNYFHEMTLVVLFTIHANLHAMNFPLIFGETNFTEVPKIHKIMALEERVPYGITYHIKPF